MKHVAKIRLVILWEHELIAAAKSLEPFAGKGQATPEQAENMLRACFAALYSPELASGTNPVTIMSCKDYTK